jgi:hypothetical protein
MRDTGYEPQCASKPELGLHLSMGMLLDARQHTSNSHMNPIPPGGKS